MRRLLVLCLSVAACGGVVPPAPPQPREATKIAAPAGKTWDAVIDAFAARNIPIRNMERASGFISTDILAVDPRTGKALADCGTVIGMGIPADRATYNVVVRGDSSSSSVKATVRWTSGGERSGQSTVTECSTRGTWESEFESAVKARAEGAMK